LNTKIFFILDGPTDDVHKTVLPSITEARRMVDIIKCTEGVNLSKIRVVTSSSERAMVIGEFIRSFFLDGIKVTKDSVLGVVIGDSDETEVKFFQYLAKVFTEFVEKNSSETVVMISEYEVVKYLTRMFRFVEPMAFGEVLEMDLSPWEDKYTLHLDVKFRGEVFSFEYELPAIALSKQFQA